MRCPYHNSNKGIYRKEMAGALGTPAEKRMKKKGGQNRIPLLLFAFPATITKFSK